VISLYNRLNWGSSANILTDHSNRFRATFTIEDHPLFIGNRVLDYGSLRIEKWHVPNQHIPNIPFTVSANLFADEFAYLRNCTTSSRRWDCK
jgi:hypothetical protein